MGDRPRQDGPRLHVIRGGAAPEANRALLTARLIRATADAIAAEPWAWALSAPPPPRLCAL